MQLVALDEIPSVRTVATRVEPRALRAVRRGHPWVFDHSIRSQQPNPTPGDLAVIFDDRRRFVGIGLADPSSPIAIRMLHHGSPLAIDARFFADRVGDALARRRSILDDPDTTGLRLIHGENDRLPGLVVDRYADILVVKLYTGAWERHLRAVLHPLVEACDTRTVVLRASRAVQRSWSSNAGPSWRHEGSVLAGDNLDTPVPFRERGLTFLAEVRSGHKTGFFLDQRDNRQRVRRLAAGARVLDVFSSSGGFSAHAAAGGAVSVTSVDISAAALDVARHHVAVNAPGTDHSVVAGNAFDILNRFHHQRRRFDLVIIDPPSFTSDRRTVPAARRAYGRLTRAGLDVLADGGTLMQASCSARIGEAQFLTDIRARFGDWLFERVETTGQPVDHPVGFPEGGYLKAVFAHRGRRPGTG